MLNLWLALVIIGVIFCIVVLLFAVRNTIRQLETGETDFLGAVWASIFSVAALLVFIPTTIIQSGLSVGTTLASNYKTVLALSTLIVVSTAATSYSIDAFQVVDAVYTPVFAPIYIQIIVPIINVARMFLDILTCWISFILTFFTTFLTELRKILFVCFRNDPQLIATSGKRLTEAILNSTLEFFGSAFAVPLPLRQIVIETGGLVNSIANPYICACEDLSFVYDIFNATINSINLADGVDNASAVIYNIAKPTVQFAQGLFFGLPNPFQCSGSGPAYILCQISRPPKFNDAVNSTCLMVDALAEWLIYDVLKAVIFSFFDISDQNAIPDLSGLASGPLCAIVTAVEIPIDIIFHFDLVFNTNVFYLRYINVTNPIDALFPVGKAINNLFISFSTDVTDQIGCAFEYGVNTTLLISKLLVRIVHQLTTDPVHIPTFLQDYPYDPIRNSFNGFFICLVTSVADLFDAQNRVEDVLQYGFNATNQFSFAFYDAFTHVQQIFESFNDFVTYTIHVFAPNIMAAQAYALVWSVTFNNFFRGFDPNNCIAIPLNFGWGVPDLFFGTGFFCCVGNIFQAYIQIFLGLQVTFFGIYVDFIGLIGSVPSFTIENLFITLLDNLDNILLPVVTATSESNTCIISSLFADICCPSYGNPCSIDHRISIPVATLIGVINTPVIIVTELIRLILGLGKDAIVDPTQLFQDVFCNVTKLGYDASVGVIARIVQGFVLFGACFANEGLEGVANAIQTVFIDDSGIKSILCAIAEIIVKLISLLFYLFSGDINDFAIQLIALIPGLGSAVNTAARVVCYVEALPGYIGACFTNNESQQCILGSCFSIPNLANVINCIIHIPNLSNSPCNSVTVIPNKKRSSGELNLEELMDKQMQEILSIEHSNDTTSPCYDLALFMENNTNEDPLIFLKHAMRYEYRRCVTYVGISDYINVLAQDKIIPRDYLYDSISFINGTVRLVDQMSPIFIWFTMNHLKHKYNITWPEYKAYNNITNSTLSGRIGDAIYEVFSEDIQDWQNSTSVIAFVIGKVMKWVKILGYDVWFGDKGLYSIAKKTYVEISKRKPGVYIDFFNEIKMDPGLKNFLNKTMYKMEDLMNQTMHKWSEFARPKSHRVFKNRMAAYMIVKNITIAFNTALMKNKNIIKRNAEWWDETVLPNLLDSGDRKRQFDPCIGGKCLNCSILQNTLQKWTSNVEVCIEDMRVLSYDINKIYIKDPDHKYVVPSVSLLNNYPAQQLISKNQSGIGIAIFKIINYIPNKLGLDLFQLANVIGTFFTTNNKTDINSVVYWLYFVSECDFERDLQCRSGPTGFGLYYSILFMGVIFITITLFVTIFFGTNMFILTFIWILFPAFVLFGAYFWNPRCFPAPPDCIYDDIYAAFKYFEYPCLHWNGFFPGITTEACPDASTNYMRPFTNCYNDYYGFGDAGFRNIFYLFERYEPSVNNWIRTSESIFAITLRNLPVVTDNINFPWTGPGLPPQFIAFEGCFRASILSMAVPAFLGGFFLFFLICLTNLQLRQLY